VNRGAGRVELEDFLGAIVRHGRERGAELSVLGAEDLEERGAECVARHSRPMFSELASLSEERGAGVGV
jgi:hypothetical protein